MLHALNAHVYNIICKLLHFRYIICAPYEGEGVWGVNARERKIVHYGNGEWGRDRIYAHTSQSTACIYKVRVLKAAL